MNFVSFIPAIVWFLLSIVLLAIPGNDLPSTGLSKIPFFDKIVHIVLFLGLTFLFLWPFFKSGYSPQKVKSWAISISLYAFVVGVAMEFVQKYLVANRSFDEVDILFDGIGCLAGAVIGWQAYKKIGPDRHRGRNQN